MDDLDWPVIYQTFWSHIRDPSQVQPDTHVCTPNARDCTHWHVPNTDYYICEQSGSVHLCTLDACHCLITTAEARVCPISGLSFPLDADDTLDQTHKFDGTHRVSFQKHQHQIYFAPPKKKLKKKHRVTAIISATITKLLMSPERRATDKKHIQSFTKSIQYKFRTYMTDCMKRKKPILFPVLFNAYITLDETRQSLIQASTKYSPEELQAKCRLYTRKCLYWWNLIKPRVTSPKEKYEPLFHTVAYLYTSAKGLRDELQGPQIVLPKDPFLAQHLPPIPSLADLDIKPRQFTKHQSILQRIMGQIYLEEAKAHASR